jgi:retron-type reverse transcriptase
MRDVDSKDFFQFVRQQKYLPVLERVLGGEGFSIPVKKYIAKEGSDKKRVVYTLPEDETMMLRFLTWLMIRKYDGVFSPGLYSFRPGVSISKAFLNIVRSRDVRKMYSYKLDASNYFNSIDVALLLPVLKELLGDDPQLYEIFERQLSDPRAIENDVVINEAKGAMAGLPTSVFFANLYLASLDREFEQMQDVIYCRYSDDIIVFSPDLVTLENAKSILHDHLSEMRLSINPAKVVQTAPGEKWTFLGFSYQDGEIDVCAHSVRKLKSKMRRKARALIRWKHAKGKDDWMAARAFVKYFNKRLYTSEDPHEINWSRWYFPLINTDRSLKVLDAYMQDCIRYIVTESRTKSRYNFRYEQMKDLGYRSLVHEWYLHREQY